MRTFHLIDDVQNDRRELAGLTEGLVERAELRSDSLDAFTKFVECFPPLKPKWRPVTESRLRAELCDGRLILAGKSDLTLGAADGLRAGKVIIDFKTGGFAPVHLDDLRFYALIETLRMARQVGGTELTTVLRALSSSVRADAALRAEVEARQSWVRGAAVLGVTAPWVILGLLALRPEGAQAYGSPEGVVLIVVGAVMSVVAYRVMIRLGRLPEPRRWFA